MSDEWRLARYAAGGFAAVALGTLALRALEPQPQVLVESEEVPAEPAVKEPADPAAEEERFTENGGQQPGLLQTVGEIGGSLGAGAIPGVGLASLAGMALEEVEGRWATSGASKLLTEAGREQDLQRFMERQGRYDEAGQHVSDVVDEVFDILPLPDNTPPVIRGAIDGTKDTLTTAITAPLTAVGLLDSGVTAIDSQTNRSDGSGGAMADLGRLRLGGPIPFVSARGPPDGGDAIERLLAPLGPVGDLVPTPTQPLKPVRTVVDGIGNLFRRPPVPRPGGAAAKAPVRRCRKVPKTRYRTKPFTMPGICPWGYVNHVFRECRQYYTRMEEVCE